MKDVARIELRRSGLKVNAEAIGRGMYGLITKAGEESIVAFGMLPKWIMDILDAQLRQKVLEIVAKQTFIPADEIECMIDPKSLDAIVAEITKEVISFIYTAAAGRGKLLV